MKFTSPDNIPYPESTDEWAPLEQWLADIASATQKALQALPRDSGWIMVADSGATLGSFKVATGYPVQYRRIGQIVYLTGQLWWTASGTPNSAVLTILPAGFRPAKLTFAPGVLPWQHYNQVEADGTVKITSGTSRTSSTGYPLDGLSFVIA